MPVTTRHVLRARLTDVVATNRVTVVEAGAGFGKSALAAECGTALPSVAVIARLEAQDSDVELFVSRLRRAFRLAGMTDLADVIEGPPAIDNLLAGLATTMDPVLLVLDDVHAADGDAVSAVIVDLAESLPDPHRMLILGRNLAGAAQKLRYAHAVTTLSATELAFRSDELQEVLGVDDARCDDVMRATGGWPAAVVLAARRLARDATLETISQPENAVVELLRLVMSDLSPEDQVAVVQVALLPLLSPNTIGSVTNDAGLWDRLISAGMPFTPTRDEFVELPGPVRDHLVVGQLLEPRFARRAADVYLELGQVRAALDVLTLAGDSTAAARVVADYARRATPSLEFAEIAGVVDGLPDAAIAEHPRALLVFARLAGRADRFVHRFAALTRLEALLAIGPANRRLTDELNIEIAHDLLRLYRSEEAAERVEGMAERLTAEEVHTRAQLLAIQGRYACRCGDYEEGARLLHDATQLALQLGERDLAAASTYAAATESFYEAGRLEEALELTEQSLALSTSVAHRLGRMNLIADLATEVGRYEEAELALQDQLTLATRHRSERWMAYVPWGHARIASQTGDAVRTQRAIAEVERHHGEAWFNDSMRAFFASDAADLLARVGDADAARQQIATALELFGDTHPFPMIDAMIEARLGDPHVASEKFAALPENRDMREAWRILLFRAFAAFRSGEPAGSSLAADAFDRAEADGLMTALMAKESVVAQQLAGLAAEGGSLAARAFLSGELPSTITLLGSFELRRGGVLVALPPGKPTQAVKLVAAAGGRVTLDELVDALWPESDVETGRRGVRNLLNRLKPAAPDLLQRDGNDLVLSRSATVDVDQFETDAQSALAARPGDPNRTTFARTALARYRGELLPSDRYEPWASLPRERALRRFSELIDVLIAEAEASNEIDEAVRLCERAIEVDPYDDARYLRAARLLVASGRFAHAHAVIGRATAMLHELGLEPSGELQRLADSLAK